MGMGDLADIGGCGDAAEADAKTQDKTASKKLLPVGAWSLYTVPIIIIKAPVNIPHRRPK